MCNVRLFYIPYAGSSAMISRTWKKYFNSRIDVIPVELAGRGYRYNEQFYWDIQDAVDDLFSKICRLTDVSYVLCGHSLGALLVYELYYRIRNENIRLPEHMIFSASLPPNMIQARKTIYDLPDEQFLQEIIEYGGMENEILEDRKILNYFLPVLRADFFLMDTYKYCEKKEKIECSTTILYSDDISLNELEEWKNLIKNQPNFHFIEGGHFFIKNNQTEFINIISKILAAY